MGRFFIIIGVKAAHGSTASDGVAALSTSARNDAKSGNRLSAHKRRQMNGMQHADAAMFAESAYASCAGNKA